MLKTKILFTCLLLSTISFITPVKSLAQVTNSQSQEAAQLMQEGLELYQQNTSESLKQAIAKWKKALNLLRALGDRQREAVNLHNIGVVYSDLGEKQQALAYHQQALPLRRLVGEKKGEAITLDKIGLVYSDPVRGSAKDLLFTDG